MRWVGADVTSVLQGIETLPGKVNYLVGTDRSQWRTGQPLFARVRATELYSGIDLIYYADQHARLEYDFILQPGANPTHIAFRIEGADSVRIDRNGELVIKVAGEQIRQHRPVIYQDQLGKRIPVSGGYRMVSRDTIGFAVGKFDATRALVIDPVMSFSTFIGGAKAEFGWGIAVDAANNIYVAGETLSKRFASSADVLQPGYAGGIGAFGDAFVAKYSGTTRELIYRTYLGGRTDDGARSVAVDATGRAYVTGFTDSRNFPIVPEGNPLSLATLEESGRPNNAFRIFPINAFVTRVNADGTGLDFSVLLGGRRRDSGTGIALDGGTGDVFVTGFTESTNFNPVPNGVQTVYGGRRDAFVVRLTELINPVAAYSTFLGGTNQDNAEAIAVRSGQAYVTGFTVSRDFPIENALVVANSTWTNPVVFTNLNMQRGKSFRTDAFVTALNAAGTDILYSTFLGGADHDAGTDIKTDSTGNAYVTGYTFSRVFPTNTIVTPLAPGADFNTHAFVTKLNPAGALVYSAQFGSRGNDQGTGIAVDEARQQVYVAGFTTANNLFNTNVNTLELRAPGAIARRSGRTPRDGFLVALQETAGTVPLTFTNAVLFGGTGNDIPNALAVGSVGGNATAWIGGQTTSKNLTVTNTFPPFEFQENLGNSRKNTKSPDAFLMEIQFP